ncbi:transposase for insertion sequence element IS1086 [Arthrobacter sp. Hiyo8]|nr:transposase for insertion sequence element IS1086 [Arthrobacter sp. Hiyo8]
MKALTGRSAMKSPGKPSLRRDTERAFWRAIATGCTSEVAATSVGVSQAAGTRWFRDRGGMPTFMLTSPKGRYLSFEEREEIALLKAQGSGVRQIAQELKRSPSTISRELCRNAATRAGKLDYRASVAQWKAERFAQRPKTAKLVTNERLHQYVQDKLAGVVRAPDGRIVTGPGAPEWTGRNKPHRGDREWVTAWSPEQISNRLKVDFPDDESMRISHEAIYQALYIQGRGALKRELVLHLRTGRALRVPRARSKRQSWAHVTEETLISNRPPEVADRAVPGHWEGDLVIGLQRSAIGTLVERTTRFTMLIHLPREEGYGIIPRTKNGPALAGYGAVTMADALAKTITTLPQQLRQSVTWDRGKELSDHARFTVDTGVRVYFADPKSPWQRGTNENTNGLLRQYFPKGTDLSRWSSDDLAAIAHTLNTRPRKALGWKTPAEALEEQLRSVQQPGVATTG